MLEAKIEDMIFLDKGFDEVIVSFVGIETVYSKCDSSFSSKSKLHKQIKNGYIGETLPSFSTQPSLFISIIILKAIHQSLGLGFKFKGWIYNTTSITIASKCLSPDFDLDSTACLDTGCGVIFVNKNQHLKRLPG